jgi:hypothetical protein
MFVPYTNAVHEIKRTQTVNSFRRYYSFNDVLALIDELVDLGYIREAWCKEIVRHVLLHV